MPLTRSRSFAILISCAVFGSSFSRAASDPLASSSSFVLRGRLPHRRHLSPYRVVIAITRPACRLVRAGSVAGRYHPLVVIISLLASKQAGWRVHVVHIVHVVHVVRVFASWLALRYGFPSSFVPVASKQATGRCCPCHPYRPCGGGFSPHRRASRPIGADERGVVIHVVV